MLEAFYDFVRNTREYGLLYTTNRYYSNYMGGVEKEEDLKDPQGQQRVRVSCFPVTLREEPLSAWAYPVTPYAGKDKGFVMPPDEGDTVWVWFDEGRGDQPRYIGSWWQNDDTEADPKSPDKSYLPKEFRPKDKDTRPTARGWKTKRGHGILMEDNTEHEIGHRVEIWTGEQEEEGEEATKHHHLEFNDKDQFIQINSFGKEDSENEDERLQHALRMDDKEEFVQLRSAGQKKEDYHYIELQDADGYIRVQTAEKKYYALLDEESELIQIKCEEDYQTSWNQKDKQIKTSTPNREITLDDNGNTITIKGPKQTFEMGDDSGTSLSDTSGSDVKVTSDGGFQVESKSTAQIKSNDQVYFEASDAYGAKAARGVMDFSSTYKVTAPTTEFTAGTSFKVTTATAEIQGAQVKLAGGTFALVDERFWIHYNAFIGLFNAHFHIVTIPGAPTLPASASGWVQAPAVPAALQTAQTKAS